ncbi:MAG: Pseudouridine kinase [Alphaproteobacteria bacterium MarineAlpha2_Bin1]|nr:MAG: Pseudouridine kinase [Alphaproteobacteria bacterium MarineAlpha2_Bin1]
MVKKLFPYEEKNPIGCVGAINIDRSYKCYHSINMRDSNIANLTQTIGGVMYNISSTLNYLSNKVSFLSFLGDDIENEIIKKNLSDIGISTSHIVTIANEKTGTYTVIQDKFGQIIVGVNDMSIIEKISPNKLEENLKKINANTWVIDSNFKEKSLDKIVDLLKNKNLIATAVSKYKAPRLIPVLKFIDYLFLNKDEIFALFPNEKNIRNAIEKILKLGTKNIFVTLGSDGAVAANSNHFFIESIFPTKIVDLNGTGDAFCGAAISCIQKNRPLKDILKYGLASSSLLAEVFGSTREDLNHQLIKNRLMLKD